VRAEKTKSFISKLTFIVVMIHSVNVMAQAFVPFSENKKWGYQHGNQIIIAPEYDTAFAFDATNRIALVANKSPFNKIVNPLTGEEEIALDYFYINHKNNKVKLLAEHFPDSMTTFPDQQELQRNYLDSSNYFRILFQNKLYLFSKNGIQLSSGYDNIVPAKKSGFFETENNTELDKKIIRKKGLIDSTGLLLVKCRYIDVVINQEDSVIYCCSAVYNTKSNDDVYDYKGKLIYTNKKHIEFSSRILHVLKTYEPEEFFIIENERTKETYEVSGNAFFYLKNNKALIVNKENWFLIDLWTKKRQKVDKESYFETLFKLQG
jgi:hypothetical protein